MSKSITRSIYRSIVMLQIKSLIVGIEAALVERQLVISVCRPSQKLTPLTLPKKRTSRTTKASIAVLLRLYIQTVISIIFGAKLVYLLSAVNNLSNAPLLLSLMQKSVYLPNSQKLSLSYYQHSPLYTPVALPKSNNYATGISYTVNMQSTL